MISTLLLATGAGCGGGGDDIGDGNGGRGGGNIDDRLDLVPPELEDIDNLAVVEFKNQLGDSIEATYLVPPGPDEPRPAVIVLHGAGGLYDDDSDPGVKELERQFEEWATLLYHEGYIVLMPASFFSRGYYEWSDRPGGLDTEDRLIMRVYDAAAALEFACDQREIDCDRVAVMGFSNGASISAMSMHESLHKVENFEQLSPDRPRFKISIPFYPGCGWKGLISLNFDDLEDMYFPYGPVHIQHAEEDSLLDDCETRLEQTELLTDVRSIGRNPFELTIHDNAGHGFDSSPNGSSEDRARERGRTTALDLLADALY